MNLKIAGLSLAALAAAPAPNGPTVDITAPAASSHAAWQSQVPYAVNVSYAGKSTKFGEIPSNAIVLRASYAANADVPPHPAPLAEGVAEISRSNCTGCHDFNSSSAGPSFAAISSRYAGKSTEVALLADHIRSGSHGSWGAGRMPPHPDMSAAQATAIARWIVSSGNDSSVQYSIGKSGSVRMAAPSKPAPRAGLILSAFYTGPLAPGDNRNPATGRNSIVVHGGP